MQHVLGNIHRYEGRITSPNMRKVVCAECGLVQRKFHRSIYTPNWFAIKAKGRVVRRLCIACGLTLICKHVLQAGLHWPTIRARLMPTIEWELEEIGYQESGEGDDIHLQKI